MSDGARGNVLVACLGDMARGDDGFGVAVARELDALDLPDQVAVVDFGIRGLDLACALLEPWSAVVIVNAMARGAVPGEVHLLPLEAERDGEACLRRGCNEPSRVVALACSMGEITAPVYMVGCEPADWGDGREGLSAAARAAIPEAIRMVQWLIGQHLPAEAAAYDRR